MPGVIVDIGTGDGEFVYKLAKEHPDRFIIGIDPHHAGLTPVSARITRKPAKGGIENALFVLGNIEDLPHELDGVANQVFINFPWGSLLKAVLLVENPAWDSLKRLCMKGAYIDVLFSYQPESEGTEFSRLGIPDIDITYLTGVMVPKLADKGFKCIEIKNVDENELKRYPSSWAKKLSHGRDRAYYYLRLESV
ncbi:MAG: hypothetical protein JW712_04070 [Dehalococcoidales bacterium]|nr:hypothetical protein [Dehalococcoidales bacterium]